MPAHASVTPAPAPRIRLKFAEKAHCPLILAMIQELAEFEQLGSEVTATVPLLEATLFGERAYAEILLAYVEDTPAGFCLFFHNYSTFLARPGVYIEDIFVREPYRSQGIGMMLINAMKEIAASRHCGRMEWWVLNWNQRAIAFYQKLGAVPMHEWTVYRLTESQFNPT